MTQLSQALKYLTHGKADKLDINRLASTRIATLRLLFR